MLGIFLIVCLMIYLVIDLKVYCMLRVDFEDAVKLDSECRIYERCQRASKLGILSIIVILIGYLGCAFPFLFIEGVKLSAYITGVIIYGVCPALFLVFMCYALFVNTPCYIKIDSGKIEYKNKRFFTVGVHEIKKVTHLGLGAYQIHFTEKGKRYLNLNVNCFHKKKEIFILMRQLRDYVAKTAGKEKTFSHRMNCFQWKLENASYFYIFFVKTLLLLLLFYTSYCCIDYDFFRKDYTALYNALNANPAQSENAWTYYVQAAVNYVELDDDLQKIFDEVEKPALLELTDEQIEQVKQWFDDNASSWASLQKAASIRYCNATYEDISSFGVDRQEDDFSNPADDGYGQIKKLYSNINVARLTGVVDIDWIDLFEMELASSRHFIDGKTFIDQIIGYSMLHRAIELYADQGIFSLQDLQHVRMMLNEYFPDGIPPLETEGEVLMSCRFVNDMINKIRIPIQSPFNPLFLMYGSSTGVERYTRKEYGSFLRSARQGIQVESEDDFTISFPLMKRMNLALRSSTFPKVYRINQWTKTTLSAAYVFLNLEEYHLTVGNYPDDILQLSDAGLACKLPDDPDSDSSIIYSNDGNRAILYAVGENGRDDGGYRDPKSPERQRDDRIYWERNLD